MSLATLPIRPNHQAIPFFLTDPTWALSKASDEQLQTVATLISLFPASNNFFFHEVEAALKSFFIHDIDEPGDYWRQIAKIVKQTGLKIFSFVLPPPWESRFEEKATQLISWA